MKFIYNTKIITPFIEIQDGFLVIMGKSIHFVGDAIRDKKEYEYFKSKANKVIDFKKRIAIPGFIDIHTHGALGRDYSISTDLLFSDSIFRATVGVVGFIPTVGAIVTPKQLLDSVSKLVQIMDSSISNIAGAKALGINLEGPFINPDLSGGLSSKFCFREIDLDYLKKTKKIMNDKFRIMTISPELKNSMEAIAYLRENGVIPSIGHTVANEELLDKAIRAGACLVTHILNTTHQPEQNIPGVVIPGVNEYLMIRDDVMAEVICDSKGMHVKPTMLKILLRCKGIDKTIIITDSFMSAGADRSSKFRKPDGTGFYVKDGVNVQESGQIVGSAMTMELSVKSMIKHTGISLRDAILMASYNPAKIIGLQSKKGSIEVGKDADIVAIDGEFNVYATMVEGKLVYNRL